MLIKGGGNMNLDYLRYFVRLVEVGHYTRAAEQLCIAQPSLSHAIRTLEAELGVPLFEKSGRNTVLTRYGEEFLDCARRTLATLDRGVLSLQHSAQGEGLIRLGFLRSLGTEYIPALAAEFLAANQGKNIRFEFHTDRTPGLLDGLVGQKYDLVFCSRPEQDLHLTAVPVTRQELVLIVPKDHPLASRQSIDLREALPYPQICFGQGPGLRGVIDDLFAAAGGQPKVAYETEEDQVIAGLVARGFGIAVVPDMAVLYRLNVAVLRIASPTYKRELFAVHHDAVFLPPAARNFLEFAVEHSREKA